MSDLKQAVAESHFHAMRCHYHLRDRIDDDAPISASDETVRVRPNTDTMDLYGMPEYIADAEEDDA
jgi:hypothetical protein